MKASMKAAHTPAPWEAQANQYACTVFAENMRMRICDIRGWGHLTGVGGLGLDPESAAAIQEANARLIAAAPALLTALKEAVQNCPCTLAERDSGHRIGCYAPSAKETIERAEPC